ncbi:MAG: DUF2254 domain-containing protein [Chloroflexi bacterium]|nr:DUF2254 domain-containing protein [Chloroflexota bacterium]
MRARIQDLWDDALSTFWFVPALLVIMGAVLALGMLYADTVWGPEFEQRVPYLFQGTADAGRSLLAAIAGSLITVVTLAFSVLIVALNQASTQFTPRVLRNFMSDRGNQVVLGSYLGAFAYALLVLRQIRSTAADVPAFVPPLAITGAIALTLWCIGLLVYFFHHSARSLQAETILEEIHQALLDATERLYPDELGFPAAADHESLPDPPPGAQLEVVRTARAGYLRRLDVEQILGIAGPPVRLVRVVPQIGTYLPHGAVLAEVWADPAPSAQEFSSVRNAFILGQEQTIRQDALFGIRQLVDIAVKALSPGINDPTTAEHALDRIGNVIGILAGRAFPRRRRMVPGAATIFWFERPDFADFVAAAFGQIRHAARGGVHPTRHLLTVLSAVRARTFTPDRAAAVRGEVEEALAGIERAGMTPRERTSIRSAAHAVIGQDRGPGEAAAS